uniref:FAS1 domain-containing protein n=1 Tax=Chlamydomonas leiostraca TaxID=1034604 RepID=A0A7S0RI85_9CHLO|mmetsp:Transcript_23442/g.60029  ORF Transcript_23442/g.60029 Transcript_23442/m.60029 type:complete len:184 (+) Transcript_23442:70-621(+)|eukprot:CAMPEP_0202869174 /NCGR_PEP_ID=MMETSP1391-20130828/12046_1 /ASSEMBLY_ACC=CAM_ASM_000867 /TAXON_ID=1034604 /ORGANISM="Chlamydomonas leiostraca, Strain SAG 11-49" /LENGTH=183 /DNA_ID=CAMNT_0049549443 /DNA_START=70 /DNA_END=621 /DNA_ORIENTATION=+
MARHGLLVLALMLAVSLQVCHAGPTINKSILAMVQRTSSLKTLRTAIPAAGLNGTLSNKNLKWTCFLPVDKAFNALVKNLAGEVTLADLLADKASLAEVLTYHCTEGTFLKSKMKAGSLSMLNDEKKASDIVQVVKAGTGFYLRDSLGARANVSSWDNIAGAAVVHLITGVLMPGFPEPASAH